MTLVSCLRFESRRREFVPDQKTPMRPARVKALRLPGDAVFAYWDETAGSWRCMDTVFSYWQTDGDSVRCVPSRRYGDRERHHAHSRPVFFEWVGR